MYSVLRPILFRFDPEQIHHFVVRNLRLFNSFGVGRAISRAAFCVDDPRLEREVFGLRFKNPVGLGAGFDKNAEMIAEMANLGFGFVEVGTVTPLAQPGNDTPRMFRLPADEALINRMGFNNLGVEVVAQRIKAYREATPANRQVIVGGNIGKNKLTPNEEAVTDYVKCFNALHSVVDYFVVNVSSPNTPGLRQLQEKGPLMHILNTLQQLNLSKAYPRPILLKIAPDLTDEQLNDIVDIVLETGIAGVIATNTTLSRSGLLTAGTITAEAGGLSGKPLTARSTDVIRYIVKRSGGKFPVIGVGGIHSPQDALDKLAAGASLVQLYTGFIYSGPALIKQINKKMLPGV